MLLFDILYTLEEITGLFGVALQHFSALALGIFGVVCVLQFLRYDI